MYWRLLRSNFPINRFDFLFRLALRQNERNILKTPLSTLGVYNEYSHFHNPREDNPN